ncbi:MAG: hypothetical protein QXV17_14860 [Candidatus Micrarchaeaceae archaeon]
MSNEIDKIEMPKEITQEKVLRKERKRKMFNSENYVKIVATTVYRQPNVCRVIAINDPMSIDIWTQLTDSQKKKAWIKAGKDNLVELKLSKKQIEYIRNAIEYNKI